jgi:hypothetical protein
VTAEHGREIKTAITTAGRTTIRLSPDPGDAAASDT